MNTGWDVEDIIRLLYNLSIDNLIETKHFTKHIEENIPEISSVINDYILCKKPVGILKQDNSKFKLYYELDEIYDLIVIIGIKSESPTTISLITCFKQESKRRVRKDD
ncbi:hypothetical protein [Methanococcus aeolicus]|uniref:hypothetical protein n=1 Tax=Methanococcus aeolicus TaxID=42879 RepID=UPI0021C89158|nr:hypothetical protein [Methanococcus aeolicus]UXM85125.1 hypothetical protein N6C89_02265 [Methanococcus aeolicus]